MSFQRSTPEEVAACEALVNETERAAEALVRAGKKVHFVWDVDHVLVSGRSDDAFSLLGYDVKKYFVFEERQVTQFLEDGPWARFARLRHGEVQTSQDIVTARSSFLALRVMFWLINGRTETRWQLFVGHQSKAESYRIILKSFEKDPDMYVFMVDDAKKHVDTFDAVAAELGMSGRCYGIQSPQIRLYDEAELRLEVDNVMNFSGDTPALLWSRPYISGKDMGRYVQVVPDPWKTIHGMLMGTHTETFTAIIVEQNRSWLEPWADRIWPGKKHTVEDLFLLFEIIRDPR